MRYDVVPSPTGRPLLMNADRWSEVPPLTIGSFHEKTGDHRPHTEARLTYHPRGLSLLITSHDRYVVCRQTEFQSLTSTDTCAEFFVQPAGVPGYYNFEINCGGALLVYYIIDPTPAPPAYFKDFTPLPPELGRQVIIEHTAPSVIDAEITEPYTWTICCQIPYDVMQAMTAPPKPGDVWLGNFFKAGGHSSHPHWASWSSIGEKLRFHQPQFFGQLVFK